MPPKTKPADPRLRVGRAVRKKFTGSGWFDGSVTSIADGSFEVRWSDGDEISYPSKAATKMLDAAEKPSGKKKPVTEPRRKQLATKKKPPPQKRPPPTPSSSSEDDDEPRGSKLMFSGMSRDSSSDSEDDDWRNAPAAECWQRWGACPYKYIFLDLIQRNKNTIEESEFHNFSSGTVKPAVGKWTCPSEVEYKPREGESQWFIISDDSGLWGSFGVEVRGDDEYDYEVNYDVDCEFHLDKHDVMRILKEQEEDEKKWTKKKTYYDLSYWVLWGGSALFDVKVEENEDGRVFKVRLREASFSIPKYEDILGRMERIPKRPKRPRKTYDELRKQVESLEAENAKLKRRLDRHEGTVLDLTAEDSDDDEAPPPRSKLGEFHDKETTKRVDEIKKERDAHESRGELLDSMVTPLESQRRQLQELVSAAAEALMERGVPTRMLADDAVPFYYAQHSWEAEQEVPWNVEAERPMSLAEGIAWVHDNPKPPRWPRR